MSKHKTAAAYTARRLRKEGSHALAWAGAAALAAGLTLSACSSGPSAITAHGTELDCTGSGDITAGSQVTVTDATGRVISTSSLTEDNSRLAQQVVSQYDALQAELSALGGSSSSAAAWKFTVTVPGGLARYGIAIGGPNRGVVWFTPQQMAAGPGLSLGCS
jgi:hypothetical protein